VERGECGEREGVMKMALCYIFAAAAHRQSLKN